MARRVPERSGFDENRRRPDAPVPATTSDLLSAPAAGAGLGPVPLDYDRPLHIVRGEGVWLFDARRDRYLDAYNNVPVVGMPIRGSSRRSLVRPRTLNTNMRYLHPTVVELAERLIATTPDELDTVMFVNTGSEANDLAWRIATSPAAIAAASAPTARTTGSPRPSRPSRPRPGRTPTQT